MMLSVSWRLTVSDQFWKRGSVNPSAGTHKMLWPFWKVGSMNGGILMFSSGQPSSR